MIYLCGRGEVLEQRLVIEALHEANLEDRARVKEVRHDVPREGDQHPHAHHVRAVLPLWKVQLTGGESG